MVVIRRHLFPVLAGHVFACSAREAENSSYAALAAFCKQCQPTAYVINYVFNDAIGDVSDGAIGIVTTAAAGMSPDTPITDILEVILGLRSAPVKVHTEDEEARSYESESSYEEDNSDEEDSVDTLQTSPRLEECIPSSVKECISSPASPLE